MPQSNAEARRKNFWVRRLRRDFLSALFELCVKSLFQTTACLCLSSVGDARAFYAIAIAELVSSSQVPENTPSTQENDGSKAPPK